MEEGFHNVGKSASVSLDKTWIIFGDDLDNFWIKNFWTKIGQNLGSFWIAFNFIWIRFGQNAVSFDKDMTTYKDFKILI